MYHWISLNLVLFIPNCMIIDHAHYPANHIMAYNIGSIHVSIRDEVQAMVYIPVVQLSVSVSAEMQAEKHSE